MELSFRGADMISPAGFIRASLEGIHRTERVGSIARCFIRVEVPIEEIIDAELQSESVVKLIRQVEIRSEETVLRTVFTSSRINVLPCGHIRQVAEMAASCSLLCASRLARSTPIQADIARYSEALADVRLAAFLS